MVQSSYLKGNTTKPNTNEEQLNDIFCEAVSFDTSKNDCPISLNGFHYCPVKILDLEINRVDHHPLGR